MTEQLQLKASAVCTNCQMAMAERSWLVKYRLQTEVVTRTRNPPFPAAATASLAKLRSHRPSSIWTPDACPDDHATMMSVMPNDFQHSVLIAHCFMYSSWCTICTLFINYRAKRHLSFCQNINGFHSWWCRWVFRCRNFKTEIQN